MIKIIETQKVKLFIDQDNVVEQEAFICGDDYHDIWITVSHDGAEISLSLTNWDKLIALVDKARLKTATTL
jgi:hypothetical protein